MTITGLSGDIGSGKSWKMLQYGLDQVNTKKKYLVTNFALNIPGLKKYCVQRKLWWVLWIVEHGFYSIVSFEVNDSKGANLSLVPFFKGRSNSVCLLDECGIFCNARNFGNTPAQLLMDLAQSRKAGNDLIWASQFDTQVDIQFRNLTQFWIHCDGYTSYDKVMRRPKLVWKTYFHFKGGEYQRWQSSAKARTSFIRTWFAFSFHTEFGPLSKVDIALFNAFDSFTRLEEQAASARELSTISYASDKDLLSSAYYKKCLHQFNAVHHKLGTDRWVDQSQQRFVLTFIKILSKSVALKSFKPIYLSSFLSRSIIRKPPRPKPVPIISYREPVSPPSKIMIAASLLLLPVQSLLKNPMRLPPIVRISRLLRMIQLPLRLNNRSR